jgi:hypothetical protein
MDPKNLLSYRQKVEKGEVKMGLGPHTLLQRPPKLNEILGKPTGQGYGAARKGPSIVGKPQDVVVDEDYEQGKAFKIETSGKDSTYGES